MAYETLLVETRGKVGLVTLNRPQALNALNSTLVRELNAVLDGFARLAAAGEETLGEGTKLIGMFRAHGLLVPVWEMDPTVVDDGAAALEEPVAALAKRLDAAIADAYFKLRGVYEAGKITPPSTAEFLDAIRHYWLLPRAHWWCRW